LMAGPMMPVFRRQLLSAPRARWAPRNLGLACQMMCKRKDSDISEAAPVGAVGGPRSLHEIAKVPLLVRESPTEVRNIWLQRYSENPRVVAGVLTDSEYNMLKVNSAACPMFIMPVPRGSGYFNLVWQAQGDRFTYASLENYQSGSGTLDIGVGLFPELVASHKIVLLHAEMHTGLLTKAEVANVVRCTREAYADPVHFEWVKRFNHRPREFDYQKFVSEFRPLERWHAST